MKNLFYSILLFVVVATVSSCKKDDPKPSKTDLIAAKTWTETKAEVTLSGVTADITASYIDACDKDNTFTYTKDGKMTENVGTILCDPTETNVTGTWAWKTNETILSLSIVDGTTTQTVDFKLIDLNTTTLKILSHDDTLNADVTITFTGK